MFPSNKETEYGAFFRILEFSLVAAEAKHGFPGKAAAAYWRLLKHEVDINQGNTGYINGLDPAKAADDYIRYIYAETNEKPDFLISVEGR